MSVYPALIKLSLKKILMAEGLFSACIWIKYLLNGIYTDFLYLIWGFRAGKCQHFTSGECW